ncbi:MAG TPA: hypothetical protein VIV63_06340 [Steroidobacteraceae bacterium]
MNDDITTAVKVLAVLGGATVLLWIGVVMVKAAKRGGGGMQALGAALMMLGWGNMRDPSNNTVAEAQDGRIRKGTHSGDPLEK